MSQIVSRIATRKIDEDHLLDNPFPGLRPFNIEESHLFFGREGQTDEVLMKLSENRFVSVIGPSGSGKSSFVYCGVLPILYGGFLAHKGPNWSVIVARPGASPIENLADALLDEDEEYKQASEEDKRIQRTITVSLLKSSSLGLVEAIKQLKASQDRNFLILIDQFEELFRFRKVDDAGKNTNESLAFVNLLMEAVQNVSASIYVATTMRSDFIGDCAEYPELTKKINDSHYLIPQMTRDQKRMAIIGPVAVGGGQITPRLVQQLLNDLGEKSDQLPILQHALMRTWAYWRMNHEGQEPIDIHHYEAIGMMTEALSRHANEAYEELSEEQQRICEIMFKALTEKRGEGDGIRRPTKLQEVADLADVQEEKVFDVVEKFREPGRSLLTPPAHIKLTSETYLDISHESLMRIWERLKIWADEEGESARLYLRLAEASAMFQVGKAGLWRPPDLQLALNWEQKYNPSLTWAQRYHPAFERTMVFLEYSRKEWETEQKQKELQQKRALKRARITALVLGSAAVISIAFLIYAFSQKVRAEREEVRANEQRDLAIQNEQLANENAEEAMHQQNIAEINAAEALRQQGIAEENAEEALRQQNIAEANAAEALRQQGIAEENAEEALRQKGIAEENAAEAERQRRVAEAARIRAERLRKIAIAKQMAIKSRQIPDPELQGLLAQQAYIFNTDNQGYAYDYDIYSGLYYAVKSLQENKELFNALTGHTGEVKDLVADTEGDYVYSASSDGYVYKWPANVDNPEPEQIAYQAGGFNTLALSKQNRWLAAGGDFNTISIFDLNNNGKKINSVNTPDQIIRHIAFASDGEQFVATGRNGGFYLYNGSGIISIEDSGVKINALAVNPVKMQATLAYDNGEVALFNLDTREKEIFIRESRNKIYAMAINPQGSELAIGNAGGLIQLWDIDNMRAKITLTGHEAVVRDLRYSRDGKQLASGNTDGTVRLWNLAKLNEQPILLDDHTDFVWSITFSQDNEYIYAGCTDGILRKWPTRILPLSNVICNKVTRNLTPEEWNLYVEEDIEYEETCPD